MSRATLAAAALLAIVVAACSTGGATPSPSPDPSASPSPSPAPTGEAAGAWWWVDPAELPLDPTTTVIKAVLMERECASGQSPEGRVLAPEIEYGEDEIVISFEVVRREGDQDCPGNPEFPIEIQLDEPLGDRALVDGFDGRDATEQPA